MSVREFVAKKLSCLQFNRLRRTALASAVGLALAACSHPPVTVVEPTPAESPSGTAPESGLPGAATPVPGAPASPNLPSAAPAYVGGMPMPAAVKRPAGHKPADRSKFFARSSWSQLPGWQADAVGPVWNALLEDCRAIMLRTGRPISLTAPASVDPYAWQETCAAAGAMASAQPPTTAQVRAFMEKWLEPWSVRAPGGEPAAGIATGYYEPLVRGARVRGGAYQWPLYAVPSDLLTIDLGSLYPELAGKRVRGKLDGKRVVPYDTRADIDRPDRQPPAIVWVDDPVDAFFLQVQGTGRVDLDTGSVIRLAYADHNGHPYVSIGKWLIDQGQLTLAQASMQGIKAWARRNPARVKEMLNANPAIVFFREEAISKREEGPRGAYGVPLTALRSIAVDAGIVPLGSPVFLATTQPNSKAPLNQLMFAQDTGAAIRGPARADVFWGYGEEAGEMAGRMKQATKMWVLWPKGEGAPAAAR